MDDLDFMTDLESWAPSSKSVDFIDCFVNVP